VANNGNQHRGRVKNFFDDKGFGFIIADGGSELFFHRSSLPNGKDLKTTIAADTPVTFIPRPRPRGGMRAYDVRPLR
jgi:cold shock CspA family protein